MPDFSRRSPETEWMDTERVSEADFVACLRDLSAVNTVTLARRPTVNWLRRAARGLSAGAEFSVLDVGFGQGDMLRRVHRWATRRGLRPRLVGVDLNPASATAARAATPPGIGIEYETGDLFSIDPARRFDVILSSLFAHHLTDAEVVRFLRWMEASAARGWFVNDLHRHALAYHGFRALSGIAGWHRFVRHDGPISVARAFRRRDWARLLDEAGLRGAAEVRWYMPFRLCVGRLK